MLPEEQSQENYLVIRNYLTLLQHMHTSAVLGSLQYTCPFMLHNFWEKSFMNFKQTLAAKCCMCFVGRHIVSNAHFHYFYCSFSVLVTADITGAPGCFVVQWGCRSSALFLVEIGLMGSRCWWAHYSFLPPLLCIPLAVFNQTWKGLISQTMLTLIQFHWRR